jgi:hypothetical protein
MAYDSQKRFFFRKVTGLGIASINLFGEEMILRAEAEGGSFSDLNTQCVIDSPNNILQND